MSIFHPEFFILGLLTLIHVFFILRCLFFTLGLLTLIHVFFTVGIFTRNFHPEMPRNFHPVFYTLGIFTPYFTPWEFSPRIFTLGIFTPYFSPSDFSPWKTPCLARSISMGQLMRQESGVTMHPWMRAAYWWTDARTPKDFFHPTQVTIHDGMVARLSTSSSNLMLSMATAVMEAVIVFNQLAGRVC